MHPAVDDDPEVTAGERAGVASPGLLGPPLRGVAVAVHDGQQRHLFRALGPLSEKHVSHALLAFHPHQGHPPDLEALIH